MSIKWKVKNLVTAALEGEVNVIAHGCNCQNTMKSGIAPHIAKAFPSAWQVDQDTKKGAVDKLGNLTFSYSKGVLVFNLYSQYTFTGRRQGKMDLDYEALNSALVQMAGEILAWSAENSEVETSSIRVGVPKIGAGLAGGDWKIIYPLIENALGRFDTTIYVLSEKDIE